MILNFKVENQKLERCNEEFIVNNAHNYQSVNIQFNTNDWEEYEKFVILKNSDREAYLFHYDDTEIILPYSIVKGTRFSISCYGVDENQNRITTNEISILLNESGYTTDISEIPPEEEDIIADIYNKLRNKSEIGHNHTIEDIIDLPNIPVKISDLINDSDFIEKSETTGLIKNDGSIDTNHYLSDAVLDDYVQKSNTNGLIKNDGTIDTTQYLSNAVLDNYIQKNNTSGLVKNDGSIDTIQYISDVSDKEDKQNKVTAIGVNSTDTEYPSAKCVYDTINTLIGDIVEDMLQ